MKKRRYYYKIETLVYERWCDSRLLWGALVVQESGLVYLNAWKKEIPGLTDWINKYLGKSLNASLKKNTFLISFAVHLQGNLYH